MCVPVQSKYDDDSKYSKHSKHSKEYDDEDKHSKHVSGMPMLTCARHAQHPSSHSGTTNQHIQLYTQGWTSSGGTSMGEMLQPTVVCSAGRPC